MKIRYKPVTNMKKALTKRQKKMIKTHKKRMYHLRVWNEDWELLHQKRWDEDTLCFEDKCDCKPVKGVE